MVAACQRRVPVLSVQDPIPQRLAKGLCVLNAGPRRLADGLTQNVGGKFVGRLHQLSRSPATHLHEALVEAQPGLQVASTCQRRPQAHVPRDRVSAFMNYFSAKDFSAFPCQLFHKIVSSL